MITNYWRPNRNKEIITWLYLADERAHAECLINLGRRACVCVSVSMQTRSSVLQKRTHISLASSQQLVGASQCSANDNDDDDGDDDGGQPYER